MTTWTRRVFVSTGLTQIPPGPHLAKMQVRYGGGSVVLMIDVSGSMDGWPIQEAVRGAQLFVTEAIEARYDVSVMLWNVGVVAVTPLSSDPGPAQRLLSVTDRASGGNALDGPLITTHQMLANCTGDRVVALFGDGDLTPTDRVLQKVAEMKSDNVRFITRGLGASAGAEFGRISDEEPEAAVVHDVSKLAEGIASMATGLRGKR